MINVEFVLKASSVLEHFARENVQAFNVSSSKCRLAHEFKQLDA
jgi:hypothetical protein